MTNFFGYHNEAHARSILGSFVDVIIKDGKARTRDLHVCTRGLGNGSWHPPDEAGRLRFCYYGEPVIVDGFAYTRYGPYWVDYGTVIAVVTYTFKEMEFSWQL